MEKSVFSTYAVSLSDNCEGGFEWKCSLVPTVSSQPDHQFSHPDKLRRMSKSVPASLQDEASWSFEPSDKWNQMSGFAMPRLVCLHEATERP